MTVLPSTELLSKELCKMHEQTTDHTTGHTQKEVHAVRHSQPPRQKQRFRDKQRPEHAERGQANSQPNRRGQTVCYQCGSLTRHHRDYPFINAVCYGCDRKGHIQAVYAGRLGSQPEKGKWLSTWWNNEQSISQMTCSLLPHTQIRKIADFTTNLERRPSLWTWHWRCCVARWPRCLETHWIAILDIAKDPTCQLWQATYSSHRRMQRHCVLQLGNQTLPLIVVEKAGTSLFALDRIKAFQVDVNALLYHNTPTTLPSTIDCNVIEKCDRDLQRILDQYPAVFSPGLGLCTKVKARLLLKEDAIPKFVKPRPVLFSHMEAVDKELHRLEDLGIITRVDHSEWATPIVVLQKPNGKVRRI